MTSRRNARPGLLLGYGQSLGHVEVRRSSARLKAKKSLIGPSRGGGRGIPEGTDPKPPSTTEVDLKYGCLTARKKAGLSQGVRTGRLRLQIATIDRGQIAVRGLAMETTSFKDGKVDCDTGLPANSRRLITASLPVKVLSDGPAVMLNIQLPADVSGKLALEVGGGVFLSNVELATLVSKALDSAAVALKRINTYLICCLEFSFGGFGTAQLLMRLMLLPLSDINFLIFRMVEGLRACGKLNGTLFIRHSDLGNARKKNSRKWRACRPTGGTWSIGDGGEVFVALDY